MSQNHVQEDPTVTGEMKRQEYSDDIPAFSLAGVEIADQTQEAQLGSAQDSRLVLTADQVRQLGTMAEFGLSLEEMTQILGVCKSKQTLINRYNDVIEQGRSRGNYMLRRRQYDVAMAGDVKMLIWLGKTRLGQRETVETINHQVLPWGNDLPDDQE
jgi:hypothetical protein